MQLYKYTNNRLWYTQYKYPASVKSACYKAFVHPLHPLFSPIKLRLRQGKGVTALAAPVVPASLGMTVVPWLMRAMGRYSNYSTCNSMAVCYRFLCFRCCHKSEWGSTPNRNAFMKGVECSLYVAVLCLVVNVCNFE